MPRNLRDWGGRGFAALRAKTVRTDQSAAAAVCNTREAAWLNRIRDRCNETSRKARIMPRATSRRASCIRPKRPMRDLPLVPKVYRWRGQQPKCRPASKPFQAFAVNHALFTQSIGLPMYVCSGNIDPVACLPRRTVEHSFQTLASGPFRLHLARGRREAD